MEFLKQFVRNPIETAALVPSSRALSRLIVDEAQVGKRECVVELGPGTGAFTGEILERISPETVFFGLEINEQFVSKIRHKYPDAIVYHASAIDIQKYLQKHDRKTTDCIISGLPWALLGRQFQEELMESIYDSLDEGGSFLTIAHITGLLFSPGIRFQKLLTTKFKNVRRTHVVWRNVMPGFVYACTK